MAHVTQEDRYEQELIVAWEALPRGRWTPAHLRLHDEIAERCRQKGRVQRGSWVYLPTDDDSFTRVRSDRAGADNAVASGRLGRSVDLLTESGITALRRVGRGRND
jgi:hypothetical protein